MVNLPLLEVPDVDYGAQEGAMVRYRASGTERALAMDNRGPLGIAADGTVDPVIMESYSRHGFYVLKNVLKPEELADIELDVADMLERAPITLGAAVDRHGRPALGADGKARTVTMVKPLLDPLGGTSANNGRHPAKMLEPEIPAGTPDYVMQVVLGNLQFSEACLRLYGHPQLLALAAAVNGEDFTPFNEAVWIKHPRLGGSVAWHQDGFTHWNSATFDEGTHGFNFMAQLYGCNAANGLWIVPGSHHGRVDIKEMVARAGSDRLHEAVPLVCDPGDVAILNRQAVHGSFANTSPKVRVTLNMGFHRRTSVLGVKGGGIHNPVRVYDAKQIQHRARMIMYGIDARRQRFPEETPFVYQPLADAADTFRWNLDAQVSIKDYNLDDLGI
jgi:hypothetical protein